MDGIDHSAVRRLVKRYQDEGGGAGLEVKRQPQMRYCGLRG